MKKTFAIIFLSLSVSVSAQVDFEQSIQEFAFKIYKASKTDSANFLLSPVSINVALAIAHEGAGGETRYQLSALLGLQNISDVPKKYQELLEKLKFQDSKDYNDCASMFRRFGENIGENHFNIYNGVWYRRDFNLNNDYLTKIKKFYRAETFDFGQDEIPSVGKEINDWISERTNGRITSLSSFINEATPLKILNAVHLLAQWQYPFDKKETKEKKFFELDRDKVMMEFMKGEFSQFYYEDKDIQAVSIPYQCELASMVIVLPRSKYNLLSIESNLTPEVLNKILSEMTREIVILTVPKFSIESEISLIEPLGKLGVTGLSDFSLIDSENRVRVDDIIHKTFIETDEEKTEATALTELIITSGTGPPSEPPVPKVFTADHPFMFFIIDGKSKTITFMGRLVRKETGD